MYETPFSLSWTMIGKIWSCATSSNGRNTWSSYHRIKSDVVGGLALEMKKKWIGKIRQDQISDLKIYIAMYKFWLSSCILSCKVEKILKGSQDLIPSPSHSRRNRSYLFQVVSNHCGCTPGCHGCQMTRNFMRNSKILIARSTIQPKLSKIKNH